ncbi:MAG: hypothetical protein GC137_03270 [Alphaproteobacteria bacterium]|nr:hypothetical protein [Alphaproteobacteria bacterium]
MIFKETQRLRNSWIIYLLVFIQLPVAVLMTIKWISGEFGEDGYIGPLIFFTVFGALMWLLWSFTLETRIDQFGWQYRCPPLIRNWRKLAWKDIVSIEIKKKGTLWKFAGLGIRYRFGHWAYIFNNTYSVLLTLKDRQLEFSTMKPEQIRSAVAEWKRET